MDNKEYIIHYILTKKILFRKYKKRAIALSHNNNNNDKTNN